MAKPATWAEDLYNAAQQLGINIDMEECKRRTLKSKARAAALGLTDREYVKYRLREVLEEPEVVDGKCPITRAACVEGCGLYCKRIGSEED